MYRKRAAYINDETCKLSKEYIYSVNLEGDTVFHNVAFSKNEIVKYIEGKHFLVNRNGNILQEFSSKKGKLTGDFFKYFITGKIEIKGQYYKGKKIGKWLYFKENGEIEKVEYYSQSKSY
ncbi:MAG: hypothetical protein WCM76_16150 [Bacteroidota bacterium]